MLSGDTAFDLVITDHSMPKMMAVELSRRITNNGRNSQSFWRVAMPNRRRVAILVFPVCQSRSRKSS